MIILIKLFFIIKFNIDILKNRDIIFIEIISLIKICSNNFKYKIGEMETAAGKAITKLLKQYKEKRQRTKEE